MGVKHHLIDFVDVGTKYSVADYVRDANAAIDDICGRGKIPFLAGGTGLYIDSLVNNVRFFDGDTDKNLRQKLEAETEKLGAVKMLEKLASVDPEAAAKLHPNNTKRIIRALELYELTGKTFSETQKQSLSEPSRFEPVFVGIAFNDRQKLYERIDLRVDLMIESGLLTEAKQYSEISSKTTSSQAIGYKELKPYFDGEITLEQAVSNLKLATRHYAKRQMTWFRRNDAIKWFCRDLYGDSRDFTADVINYLKGVLK